MLSALSTMSKKNNSIKRNNKVPKIHWTRQQKFYTHVVKLALDIFFAVIGLVLLSPLFLIIAIIIKLDSEGPVFFKQDRVGRNGQIFNMYKFRTMLIKSTIIDSDINKCDEISKITKIGKILRKTSIDEILQIFNILKGEMSIIGPRPLLVEYLPYYSFEQMKRHCVLPGISGWAQVNGRNSIAWGKKFKNDIWYVNNISFMIDLKILIKTIWVILNRKGINNSKEIIMSFFRGNK